MKKIFIALFVLLSFSMFSQSVSDLASQAANLGISSEEDVLRDARESERCFLF